MWKAFCLLLLFQILAVASTILNRDYRLYQKNMSLLLDNLLDKNRYDKRIRPGLGGPPVQVTVNMLIKSMGPVSETDEYYVMDCYFRQTWTDKRLMYQFATSQDELSLPWLFLDRVWKPDTFFLNGKKSHLHRITVPNKFLRLRRDGFLVYSMRLTIQASCPMHLRKFPLDTQNCPLSIGSYGYTMRDLRYTWQTGGSCEVEKNVELAQYDLINITTSSGTSHRREGQYSVIKVSFLMKRHTGYFMLQVFAPCCLIVCCSWVSFWIDPDAVPARVTLGATTVLSMTTIGFGGRAQMPRVSYATALDFFVILCFSFVFSVMIEYAVVNFIDKITADIKGILEKRGIRKKSPVKEKPKASDTSADTDADQGSVPKLVVDLAPTPTKEMVELSPVYAEIADAIPATHTETETAPEAEPVTSPPPLPATSPPALPPCDRWRRYGTAAAPGDKPAYGVITPPGRRAPLTPNFHTSSEEHEGMQVVTAAMVLPPKTLDSLPDMDGSSETLTPGGSAEDLASEAFLGRRGTFLTVPPSKGGTVLDIEDPDDDLDALETLEVHIRGSMLELRENLGTFTSGTRRSFRKCLQKPIRMWNEAHFLPSEQEVTRQIMSDEPPNKFSRIDIEARKYFPMTFFTLLSIYWILFLYYITDEAPVKQRRELKS